jgi:hypothetical protein
MRSADDFIRKHSLDDFIRKHSLDDELNDEAISPDELGGIGCNVINLKFENIEGGISFGCG